MRRLIIAVLFMLALAPWNAHAGEMESLDGKTSFDEDFPDRRRGPVRNFVYEAFSLI